MSKHRKTSGLKPQGDKKQRSNGRREPKDKTVKQGVTVKWTNTGDLPHTVTKEDGPGPDFDSGTLQPGDTYEETFTTAGKIGYLCTIHSGQNGSLTVQ